MYFIVNDKEHCIFTQKNVSGFFLMKANKQSVESPAQHIQDLTELLCTPIPKGDIKEQSRRCILERLNLSGPLFP